MVSFPTSIIIVSITLPILAIVSVALRFYAQNSLSKGLHADDWAIIASLLIAIGIGILTVYGAYNGGFGHALVTMAPSTRMEFAKLLFAHQFFWTTGVAMVKISLLLFYRRIFNIRTFRVITYIMIGIIIAWAITFNLGVLFSTTPIKSQWTNTGHYNINYPKFLVTACCTDMVLDISVLTLPLTVIRTLQINTKKKLYLAGIFGLGIFCTAAAMVRLAYIIKFDKIYGTPEAVLSFVVVHIILWSVIEPCVSITTACLPLLGPLVKDVSKSAAARSIRLYVGRKSGGSDKDAGSGWLKNVGNSDNSVESNLAKKAWQPIDHEGYKTEVSSSGDGNYEMDDNAYMNGRLVDGIHVQHSLRREESWA